MVKSLTARIAAFVNPRKHAAPPKGGRAASAPDRAKPAAPAPSCVDPPGQPLVEVLGQDLEARAAEVLLELDPTDADGDAGVLVDALREPLEITLRQPPMAAQKILSATRRGDASLRQIVALIEKDPALTQGLFKYANSAYFATGVGSIASLRDGVLRVGTKGVHNVVLTLVAQGLLCRPGPEYDQMVTRVWSHLVRSAPLARRLAPAFGVEVEQAYALTLLHDAGKLVIFDRMAGLRGTLRRPVEIRAPVLGRILQALHEPLGGLAALHWGLDEQSARGIALHHRNPVPEPASPLSEVVFLAEAVDLAVSARSPSISMPCGRQGG